MLQHDLIFLSKRCWKIINEKNNYPSEIWMLLAFKNHEFFLSEFKTVKLLGH